ncbi:MAG: malonyl-ACP O-methyltransferase BioC [Victivallaceae bacterium]|nr:malonyl-ACP O-methyltransferase BioC [Victivallaceae bacterium]
MDKLLIKKRFSRRLGGYRSHAIVQREMAVKLLENLESFAGTSRFARIFEIGCGAGILSEKIAAALDYDNLILNDIVSDCDGLVDRIPRAAFLAADVESLQSLPGPFDLIISNAVVQWLSEPEKLFDGALAALNPGGVFAFSSFAPDNMREVRELTGAGLPYTEPEQLETWGNARFAKVEVFTRQTILKFEDPLDVLRHLRDTGVNAVKAPPFWNRRRLQEFRNSYESRFGRAGRVPLSYSPLYFYARKEMK